MPSTRISMCVVRSSVRLALNRSTRWALFNAKKEGFTEENPGELNKRADEIILGWARESNQNLGTGNKAAIDRRVYSQVSHENLYQVFEHAFPRPQHFGRPTVERQMAFNLSANSVRGSFRTQNGKPIPKQIGRGLEYGIRTIRSMWFGVE